MFTPNVTPDFVYSQYISLALLCTPEDNLIISSPNGQSLTSPHTLALITTMF